MELDKRAKQRIILHLARAQEGKKLTDKEVASSLGLRTDRQVKKWKRGESFPKDFHRLYGYSLACGLKKEQFRELFLKEVKTFYKRALKV